MCDKSSKKIDRIKTYFLLFKHKNTALRNSRQNKNFKKH